jgi:diguanylate cyclase (GGDEF)-like protein
MPFAEIALRFDPWGVLLSYLTASFASYVALDLAKRVRTPDRAVARGWWFAGSLSMGTGIWAMHFVGMLALRLPFEVGYDRLITVLSWVAAVAVSAVALQVATRDRLTLPSLTGGALAMGVGICAMHYTGMAALVLAPGIRWNGLLVLASAAVAVGAAAAALLIFFGLRRLQTTQARWGQFGAALVMGAAVAGMHYTGMAAAGIAEGTVCLSADGLRGDNLGLLVAGATFALLLLTLFSSTLDARMQSRAQRLSQSLQTANEELQRIAYRDALTGLANRLLFEDRVAHALVRSQRDGSALAVLFVDLDGFKPINDSFGHAEGDVVLRAVAARLQTVARSADTVARLGGDEFVLLLEGDASEAQAAQVAQRLIEALQQPLGEGEQAHRLSCSVGIALYRPGDGADNKLLAQADSAMYAAKRAGGATFAFFAPHMEADAREQLELQRDLRVALAEGGQLALHYQPKLDIARGVVSGLEALLRWQHPQRGLIGPGVFVPVAERFGLIAQLGDWVIDEACRQLAVWHAGGIRLRIALNLSVHQLRQPDVLLERIESGLRRHALDPALLGFEITESVAMEDAEATRATLKRLEQLGMELAIDDFGTGYSSLAYLRRLPVGTLKIDRSFVQDLATSGDARAIVEAVIRLAHALGLRVVAEGVETEAQSLVLARLGCDELQGYLFARPQPADELERWVRNGGIDDGLRFSASAFVPDL